MSWSGFGRPPVRVCTATSGPDVRHDEELVCIAETDACPGDAIQALLGCTLGKGNFIYHCTGKTAYTFFDRATGEGFRVIAKRNQTPLSREERKQQIYTAPLEELFSVTVPKEPLPEKARIFTTLTCACCGEGVADTWPVCRTARWSACTVSIPTTDKGESLL